MKTNHPIPFQSGFTLTEVVIALAVFAVAITALLGIMPFGMTQVQTASNESRSMDVMESIRDDISLAMNAGMPRSQRYDIEIPTAIGAKKLDLRIGDGGEIASSGANVPFRIAGTLRIAPSNAGDAHFLHLRASWPAKAPAGSEDGSTELVAAINP